MVVKYGSDVYLLLWDPDEDIKIGSLYGAEAVTRWPPMIEDQSPNKLVTTMVHSALQEQQQKEEAETALDKALLAITLDTNQEQLNQVVNVLADVDDMSKYSHWSVQVKNTTQINTLKNYYRSLMREKQPAEIAEIAEKLRDILIPETQRKEQAETELDKALLAITLDTVTQKQLDQVFKELLTDSDDLFKSEYESVQVGDTTKINKLKNYVSWFMRKKPPAEIAQIAVKLRFNIFKPPPLKWETVPTL